MSRRKALVLAAAFVGVSLAGTVSAQTPLKDVVEIRDGIVHVGMAYEISRKCNSIDARRLRGINFLYSLRDRARALGYSEAEIEAYLDNKAEEERLKSIARQQLVSLGVVEGQEATYCAVGRDQITRQTRVGWLLR